MAWELGTFLERILLLDGQKVTGGPAQYLKKEASRCSYILEIFSKNTGSGILREKSCRAILVREYSFQRSLLRRWRMALNHTQSGAMPILLSFPESMLFSS